MDIIMRHQGTFHVTACDKNQCGYVGKNYYKFRVEIRTRRVYLDERGFVLDTEEINGIFNEIKEVRSGEDRALTSADDLYKLLVKHGFEEFSLSVEIFGSSDTSFLALRSLTKE